MLTNQNRYTNQHMMLSSTSGSHPKRTRLSRTLYRCISSVVLITVLTVPMFSQSYNESQTKAMHLFNFAKFIEWPSLLNKANVRNIVIGVLGEDPIFYHFETMLKGKTIDGKEIVLKKFTSLDNFSLCHIVFVCSSEQKNMVRDIQSLRNTGALLVSDLPRFCESGGHIMFVNDDQKIRFDINQNAADDEGLKISSQLLKIASVVHKGN